MGFCLRRVRLQSRRLLQTCVCSRLNRAASPARLTACLLVSFHTFARASETGICPAGECAGLWADQVCVSLTLLLCCTADAAWTDVPTAADTAHATAECSNAGICNRNTGQCECFAGFEGDACQRSTLPAQCCVVWCMTAHACVGGALLARSVVPQRLLWAREVCQSVRHGLRNQWLPVWRGHFLRQRLDRCACEPG